MLCQIISQSNILVTSQPANDKYLQHEEIHLFHGKGFVPNRI